LDPSIIPPWLEFGKHGLVFIGYFALSFRGSLKGPGIPPAFFSEWRAGRFDFPCSCPVLPGSIQFPPKQVLSRNRSQPGGALWSRTFPPPPPKPPQSLGFSLLATSSPAVFLFFLPRLFFGVLGTLVFPAGPPKALPFLFLQDEWLCFRLAHWWV